MKKIFFKILSLLLIVFFLSAINNEKASSWSAFLGGTGHISDYYYFDGEWWKLRHDNSIWIGYKKARDLYMNIDGCGDPCWKVGWASSDQCDINWLVPGLVLLASHITATILACLPPIIGGGPGWIPVSVICLAGSIYFLEHISRVQWMTDIQPLLDIVYGTPNSSDNNTLDDINGVLHVGYVVGLGEVAAVLQTVLTIIKVCGYEYKPWMHFDQDGQSAEANGEAHFYYIMSLLKRNTPDFGYPHIRRYLTRKSLAVMLHMVADFHSHTNFGYVAMNALSQNLIDDHIAQLGILRIMEIVSDPTNNNILNQTAEYSVTQDQRTLILDNLMDKYKISELFPNTNCYNRKNIDDVYRDGYSADEAQYIAPLNSPNPQNRRNLVVYSFASASNNVGWYLRYFLGLGHDDN